MHLFSEVNSITNTEIRLYIIHYNGEIADYRVFEIKSRRFFLSFYMDFFLNYLKGPKRGSAFEKWTLVLDTVRPG